MTNFKIISASVVWSDRQFFYSTWMVFKAIGSYPLVFSSSLLWLARKQAFIFSATGREFRRPRENLRRVRERFGGDLALIVSSRPLVDLSSVRVAQSLLLSCGLRNAWTEVQILMTCSQGTSWPFNSQDLIINSLYCLPYNSRNVSLENLELGQPIIP